MEALSWQTLKQFSSKRLAGALIFSLILSVMLSALFDGGSVGMIRRGDFPAFYAAAKIVDQGQGGNLYSRRLQQTIENEHWPSLDGTYFAFAYPASFAFFLSPLAKLPPFQAKLIFLLVQSIFFGLAFVLLRERESAIRRQPIEYLAIMLGFTPLFTGLAAGQGASFNLLMLLIVIALLEKARRWEQHALLGVMLGFWLYKPQLSLSALILCAAGAEALPLFSGWMLGATVSYFAGLLAAGPIWPSLWLAQTSNFGFADFAANGFQMISLFAFFGELFAKWGPDRETGQIIGFGLSFLLVAAACVRIAASDEPGRRAALLLGPVLVLVSGHVLFYEAGLMLPALFQLTRERAHSLRILLAVDLFAFVCCMLRESLPFQPLIFLAVALTATGFFYRFAKKSTAK